MADLERSMLFENRFWLQILGDHSRFILNSLPVEEETEIKRAQSFKDIFDSLLEQARQDISGSALISLSNEAYNCAAQIREFKLHLLRRHLVGDIKINLSPTFFNHMLNELEEYMSVLYCLMSKKEPVFNPIHHHILWLSDAIGHSAAVISNLDEAESKHIREAMNYRKEFEGLYLKSEEINNYMRTGLCDFPALKCLNCQAEMTMVPFKDFLEKLLRHKLDKKLLGTLQPLMADHMAREECYYLTKLSKVSETQKPNCDPSSPRIVSTLP